MNEIRNLLLVVGTTITMLGVLIKTINDFFINTIKMKYENIPGKQSSFSFTLQILVYIIGIVSFSSWIINVINNIDKSNGGPNYNFNTMVVAIILSFFIFMPIFEVVTVFSDIRQLYINKLENGTIINMDKRYKKKIKLLKYASLVIPIITFVGFLIGLYKDERNITFWGGYGVLLLICFALFLRLGNIYDSITENFIYTLKLKDKEIVCELYLEYDEFYLIFQDKHERYIKKSEVKEIIKKEF